MTITIERFMQKVAMDDSGCWLWQGGRYPKGLRRRARGRGAGSQSSPPVAPTLAGGGRLPGAPYPQT